MPFTLYAFPTIPDVSASGGIVGAPMTITGTNLLDGEGKTRVTFNGTPATIRSDATSIQVKISVGATSGRLVVQVNGVALIPPADFTVN